MVWQDTRSTDAYIGRMIYGQRVASGGLVIGDPSSNILITDSGEEGVYGEHSLTYNTQHKQYLVAFDSSRPSPGSFGFTNKGIFGRRITLFGIPDPGGDIPIATTLNGGNTLSHVIYNAINDQYLSIFSCGDTYYHVCRQRLRWEGTRLGGFTQVSGSINSETDVTGAYNTSNTQYLTVWVDERNGNPDIYGQIYDEEGFPVGSNFAIRREQGSQLAPSVAFNSIDQIYLVTWYDEADNSIEWSLISSLGHYLNSGRVVMAEAIDRHPAAAYNSTPDDNRFAIVYEELFPGDTDPSLAGLLIDATSGTPAGNFGLGYPGSDMQDPDIVYHPGNNRYMVVWQDNRDDPGDIYG
ncbi:MAG: hypothetical protein P1S60_00940, partial [Anaerolineae bacterium]|nr:hypothetical protein [Anaerolineae bacterium]